MRPYRSVVQRLCALLLGCLFVTLPAFASSAGGSSYAGHQAIAGDFNGDGWGDLLFQALPGDNGEALLLSLENGTLGQPITWADQSEGVNWNASAHHLVVGDFNGDGRDDLFLQAIPGLTSSVMLSDGAGGFAQAPQGTFTTIGGMDVSQASHGIVVGDFNSDGRDDVLLQANDAMHNDAIALAGPNGGFRKLAATWSNGAAGLNWSADLSALTAGDFSGSGRSELLVRSKSASGAAKCCEIVTLGKQLSPATVAQQWNANWLGLDWSPADYHVVSADLNGDGRADLLLQPTAPGGTVTVLLASASGTFKSIASQWSAEQNGLDWSTQSYLLVPEPPAGKGQGGSLLMVPEQAGLDYTRAHFDTSGKITAVTTLASPPSDLFANVASGGGGASPQLSAMSTSNTKTATNTSSAVGAVPGQFSVDAMGDARYRIPIAVAPGVNGIAPKLALVYDSRGGQTQLGLGWSLAGLSSISRCPATVASDGAAAGVNLTMNDRFCLDGAHLAAYGGGRYGADGTAYHTPTASFQQVVSNGSQGSGPQDFTVRDKGGLIRESGNTSDSRLQAGSDYSNTVAAWLLDKITDRWGNFISFHYAKLQGSSQLPDADTSSQLTEIDYGNNTPTTVAKLVFNYTTLNAANESVVYMAGVPHIVQSDLGSIEVYSNGSLIWTYELSYNVPSAGPPQLTSVTQCDAGGNCLAPTEFSYVPSTSGLQSNASDAYGALADLRVGDFNGDGRSGYLYSYNGDWYVIPSGYAGSDTGINSGSIPDQALVFDANDDGHSDLLFAKSGTETFELAEWNPSPSPGQLVDTGQRLGFYGGTQPMPTAVDLLGDGYPWVFFKYNGELYYFKNTNGTFGSAVDTGYAVTAGQQLIPIRFKRGVMGLFVGGNGCTSGNACSNTEGVITWDATSQALKHTSLSTTGQFQGTIKFLDLNGDGLDDEFSYVSGSGWYLYMNHGGTFVGQSVPSAVALGSGSLVALDYTGDGRADLMYPDSSGNWQIISWAGYDGALAQLSFAATAIDPSAGGAAPVDYSGLGTGDIFEQVSGSIWDVFAHTAAPGTSHAGELSNITTGLGASIGITYGSIAAQGASTYYSPSPVSGAPADTGAPGADAAAVRNFIGPLYVVREITTSEAPGTTLTSDYDYHQARFDRTGRSFLGFANIVETSNLGDTIETDYETAFPYTATPLRIITKGQSGEMISEVNNSLNEVSAATAAGGAPFPYVATSTKDYYSSTSGTTYKEVKTTKTYGDGWGNATDVDIVRTNTVSGAQYESNTTSSYANTPSPYWCIGRLQSSSATHTGPYGATITRNATFSYTQDDKCALDVQNFEPGVSALAWTKTFGNPDAFGNWRKMTTSGNSFTARSTSTTYDSDGRYPTSTTDALGNTTGYQWDQTKGVKTKVTGPNGDAVTYGYDGFGRKTSSSGPYSGEASSKTYSWCNGGCSDGRAVYETTTTSAGAPTVTTEFDEHGRKVAVLHNAQGGTVAQAYYYDALGRRYLATAPYFTNTTPCWIWRQLDDQGRVTDSVSASNGSQCTVASPPSSGSPPSGYGDTVTTRYDGLTVTIHDNGHTTVKLFTVAGKLASLTTPTGAATQYQYDAVGDLFQKTDPDGAVTGYTYDVAGHRTAMSSPSSGNWSYEYDALGELTSQTDPTGNVITQTYNLAGDLVSRVLTDSANNTRTSTWTYGTSAPAIGRLSSTTNGAGYTRSYTYNTPGDVTELVTTADGATYTTDKQYNNLGQVTSITYPDSPEEVDVLPTTGTPALSLSPYPTSYTGSYTVSWTAVTGASTYQLRESRNGGSTWAQVYSGNSRQWQASGKGAGSYTYEARACNNTGCGAWGASRTETVSIPAVPNSISFSPSPSYDGSYTVSWAAVTGASSYPLQESTNGGSSWTQVYSGNSPSWAASGKSDGSYEYRARACDAVGCSGWSGSYTEQVDPPAGVTTSLSPSTVDSQGSYTVSWTSSSHASYYEIESTANNNNFSNSTPMNEGTALSYSTVAPPVSQTSYIWWRARACTSAGCSAWSASAMLTINPPPGGCSPTGGTSPNIICFGPTSSSSNTSPTSNLTSPSTPTGGRSSSDAPATPSSTATSTTDTTSTSPTTSTAQTATAPDTTSTWRFTVYYSYDSVGDLTEAYGPDATGSPDPGYPYWQLVSMDAVGHVTEATRANGATDVIHLYDAATAQLTEVQAQTGSTVVEEETYSYNVWGSRATRDDVLHNETESYNYDSDQRVTQATATVGGSNATTLSAAYDGAGNLATKTDAGGTVTYTYGNSAHPNRVTNLSVSGGDPGVAAGGVSYDAAGRVTSGAGYTVGYDRRGLAASVATNGTTLTLAYAPDGHRYRSALQDSSGTTTVWYVAGGAFRVEQEPGGTVAYRQAIVAGGAVIAQLTTRSDGTDAFQYFYRDGLGSTTAITDTAGQPQSAFAYGPYGRRRAAANWSSDLTLSQTPHLDPPTRRGYTGGEQFDALGAVVLGARVYVPALGRWLSPDPAGAGSPYVYVGDNPLSDVDPTGAFSLGPLSNLFDAIGRGVQDLAEGVNTYWRPILAIGLAAYTGGLAGTAIYDSLASTVTISTFGVATVTVPLFASAGAELAVAAGAGAVAGGVFGASMTALYGGNASDVLSAGLRGAAIGGLAGGAWWAAGEVSAAWGFAGQALAHGVAGGLTGVAAGGNFRKGFEVGALAFAAARAYKYFVNGEYPSWRSGHGAVLKMHGHPEEISQGPNDFSNANYTKNPALAGLPVIHPCDGCEGSNISIVADSMPGINAVSALHDVWGAMYELLFHDSYPFWFKYGTMIPAAGLAYAGLVDTPIGYGLVSSGVSLNDGG